MKYTNNIVQFPNRITEVRLGRQMERIVQEAKRIEKRSKELLRKQIPSNPMPDHDSP